MKNKRQPPGHWRLIGLIFRKDLRQHWRTLDLWRLLLLPAGLTLLFRLLWAGIGPTATDPAEPARFGSGLLFILFGVLALLLPGLVLATNLIQAEKEAGMLTNLLRTPLQPWHILLGKGGMASLTTLLAWLLVLLAAPGWQNQLGLICLSTLLALLFIVPLGLWLGLSWSLPTNQQARTPLLVVGLMLPAIVWVFPNRPGWLNLSLPLLPTHHLVRVWVLALAGQADWAATLPHLGMLLLAASLMLFLLGRQKDY